MPQNQLDNYSLQNYQTIIDEQSISYALAVPVGIDVSEQEIPLIVALHFGGKPNALYGYDFLNMLVMPAMQSTQAIMLAPVTPIEGYWSRRTNAKVVMALIDSVKEQYSIDSTRIAVTGFSLGGIGTWHFAANYPAVFSAAVPMAGIPLPADVEKIKQVDVPLYAIHSTEDDVQPFEQIEKVITELQDTGKDVILHKISGLTHYNTAGYSGDLADAAEWLVSKWNEN